MTHPAVEHPASGKVYERTAAGNDTLAQPLRLLQRNLRLLLALVDGRKSVGRLGEQFGDTAVVADSLRQLEALGLVAEQASERHATPDTLHQGRSGEATSAPTPKPVLRRVPEEPAEWSGLVQPATGFLPVLPAPTPRHEAARLAWEASGSERSRQGVQLWAMAALLGSLAFTAAVAFG